MKKTSLRNSSFAVSRGAVICLALALITVAAYWQVYTFDFVSYDDDRYVLQNPHVNTGLKPENITWAFKSMHTSNWHPLTWLSLMLDAQLFGLNAGGYHVVNLLFHIFNTLLIYMALNAMTGASWRSAAVAGLFALHPLHVESVAWVAERKDVLSTFFMMLTFFSYVRYVRMPGYKTYLPIVFFFALGLLAKPMVVTLPFVLLLLDYWPLKRFALDVGAKPLKYGVNAAAKKIGRLIFEKLPLFGLTAISVVVTLSAQRSEIVTMQYLPVSLRISNALVSYCGYLAKAIWPIPLTVLYPHPEFIPPWQTIGATAILVTITALAVLTVQRHPYFLVGWFWYLGTLVPVIGFVQVGVQSMADRYTYIPLVGVFIAAVWLISDFTDRPGYKKYLLPAFCTAIAGFLFTVTWTQLGHWRNSKALFSHALSVTKNNYVMHNNMGALLAIQGNMQDSIFHYNEALSIRPDDLEANYNLGNLLLRQGKFKDSIPYYGEAIRSKPDFAPAHNNLGIALGQSKDLERAVEQFREAVSLDPGYQEARNNLKFALARLEKPKEILLPKTSAETANTDRETAEGEVKAGISLTTKGDLVGAINHFKEALKLNPNHYDANVHLGLSLSLKQNYDEAILHFRKAIQINPKGPQIYNSLGVALANTGKIDEAIAQLEKAIRIDPNFAKAHNSLGVILARSGKIDEGLSHLQTAVRLQPNYEEARKNLEIVQSIKTKP
ncbi:MAG: tetratricopeptide repeat protein [Pseudomonadota bacterium]